MPLPLGHQGHFHSNYHKETPTRRLANVNSESVEAFRFLLDQDNNWSCGSSEILGDWLAKAFNARAGSQPKVEDLSKTS